MRVLRELIGSVRWLLPCLVTAACATDEGGPHLLIIQIDADEASAGREVRFSVDGETEGEWQPRPFSRSFCALDREEFLNAAIRVEVREGSENLANVVLDRFACQLDPSKGNGEHIGLRLDADGTLHWMLGDDPATVASCARVQPVCDTQELR